MKEETVADVIQATAGFFDTAELVYGHGTDNAVDEAAYLVFAVLGLSHDDAEAAYLRNVSAEERAEIRDLAAKRVHDRVPVAHTDRRSKRRSAGADGAVVDA